MEEQVKTHFLAHPDAEIYLSMPGIAEITGARVLAEFGQPHPIRVREGAQVLAIQTVRPWPGVLTSGGT